MKSGLLNLTTHQLTIREGVKPNPDDDWSKDTAFMAPELPAQIFKEEGLAEVTVLGEGFVATVSVMELTKFVRKITRPL